MAEGGVCSRCTEVRNRYTDKENREPVNKLLPIHIEYKILTEGGKRRQGEEPKRTRKRRFADQVAKAASALRNSGGGVLLVHVQGTSQADRCLEYFDKAVRNKLTGLLENGELYTDVYERKCLCQIGTFEDITDFVQITVGKVESVCTVDFNTKANNDSENLSINSSNIQVLLRKTETQAGSVPTAKLPDNVQDLHENRHIQLKTFQTTREVTSIEGDAKQLTDYIWSQLKLKDNITSMSKVVGGGSYFLGVSESKLTTKEGYTTKKPEYTGCKLDISQESLREHIYKKLETDICVLDLDGQFTEGPRDLIDIRFHTVPRLDVGLVVLEVAVRYCQGVVFYDKEGPRTYYVTDSGATKTANVCRMNRSEWLQRLRIMHSHVHTQTVEK
ncbi:uncharacterized protein LOC124290902 [Haliotis rubra]|uniref:uncharacterized protein LOC124290902 n=1 Tax=Haliotis rubra TaxID=36100 RepID=UPI001EE52E9D|nr:uncharacterized protein LOC124290902 [Haliotis rubra]